MAIKLTFKLLERSQQNSKYDWMNVDSDHDRVGKVRGLIEGDCLIINSIYIFPEFEGNGYGAQVIRMFQSKFRNIIADRVRPTARGFWQKMDFCDVHDGNYVWRRDKE